MLTNILSSTFVRPKIYFIAVLTIVIVYLYASGQDNKHNLESNIDKNGRTQAPVQKQNNRETSGISFDGFLSALAPAHKRVADNNSTTGLTTDTNNLRIEDIKQKQQEIEYGELISAFTHDENVNKILLLQKLWQLAPEVGIDENLLTLLHLSTHDPDVQIQSMAHKMLIDLTHFKEGTIKPEEQLVAQIHDINRLQQSNTDYSKNDEPITINPLTLNANDTVSSTEITQQWNDKINQLTQLALNSEDSNQKDYAMMNLMQFDHDSALQVIQHQLLNSVNIDERYRAVERLRAVTGDMSSLKLRRILEIAVNDYNLLISEYARASITMLDQYEKELAENSTISLYSTDAQESVYEDTAGSSNAR